MAEIRWTPEQAEAIRSTDDTLLVANAGTGKTTTVVGKILWLLGMPFGVEEETGEPLAPPESPCRLDEIAAITFTEKAAYDLKRQLRRAIARSPRADELPWEIDRASVGTIHSFCSELLREQALRLGIDPTYDVIDADEAWAEQDLLIKELILERLEADDPAARSLLQRMKLTGWEHTSGVVDHVRGVVDDLRWHETRYGRWLADAASVAASPAESAPSLSVLDLPSLRALCEEWDAKDDDALGICDALLALGREARRRWDIHLEEENLRDFDSLILGARDLLTGSQGRAALEAIRSRYRILVIDEFQDTDFAQRDIAFAIARGVPRPQLFLVGDPKQSIYRFRGADISVWNEVEAAFEADGRVLDLSRNFRSAPPIVDFVNEVGRVAMAETGEALADELPGSRVDYADLVPGVADHEGAAVEWLEADGGDATAKRTAEAKQVAARVREMVGRTFVRDPDTEEIRPLAHRDVAVLYRARTGLELFEKELTRYGVPYFIAGAPHLNDRQEILDVLNALRVIRTPRDDLRTFGFLRSPFVGLRDETIARIRLLSKGAPLLVQARRRLEEGEWPDAPDHPGLAAIERDALARGLDTLDDLRALGSRLPLDELIEELLERTGYRLHLLLMDRPEEPLANLQSLIRFAEGHRDLDLGTFFDVWDRSTSRDAGIPQAPLYSKEDDVVTLSTIHAAKGLEWPVVLLVGVDKDLARHRTNEFWSDRELGPVFCLKKDDRGPRAERLQARERLEASAEEARLLYVATTRARDRLIVVGARGGAKGYDRWLEAGVAGRGEAAEPGVGEHAAVGDGRPRGVRVRRGPPDIRPPVPAAPPSLAWLDRFEAVEPPAFIRSLPEPPLRWIHSATELMTKAKDPDAWERRYRHGVEASWEFAPEPAGGEAGLPSTVRGVVIHGVLERLEAAEELARILDETIGSLDEPELEEMLGPGSEYRDRLEEEIRRVVESEEWAWYTAGELGRDYWKELLFLHLPARRDWRFGAFDLYRRAGAGGAPSAPAATVVEDAPAVASAATGTVDGRAFLVDFKTHPIPADRAAKVARDYEIQADVYRAAAAMAGPVSLRLHFTRPNAVVEMEDGVGAATGHDA